MKHSWLNIYMRDLYERNIQKYKMEKIQIPIDFISDVYETKLGFVLGVEVVIHLFLSLYKIFL